MKKIIVFICLSSVVFASDSTRSQVFKPKPSETILIHVTRPSDVTYQLWEGFTLVRNANSGDPAAMLELAVRYLTGDGFTPDTVKAFQLVKKASEKGYLLAEFNLGVFYHNGWGVEWNPFSAYEHFKTTAEKGLREGEFAYALYFVDNLTIQRNWGHAYNWMKKSADDGYKPAKELLPEIEKYASLEKKESLDPIQSTAVKTDTTVYKPMLLDFSDDSRLNFETEISTDSSFSLTEVLKAVGPYWKKNFEAGVKKNDSALFIELLHHAEWGVPEEFMVIGRCYENGTIVKKDSILATLNYLRALRLESYRAGPLLIRLIQDGNLIQKLNVEATQGKPEALYAISCFALTEIIPAQQMSDVVNFLLRSSDQRYIPSMLELGTAYFNGQIVPQQKDRSNDIWMRAYALGSNEALVRMASIKLLTNYGVMSKDSSLSIIKTGVDEGSLLAQLTLGICYEKGIAVSKNIAEAVKFYRTSAQRGSRNAYDALKKLYDDRRPPEKEFQLTEKDY